MKIQLCFSIGSKEQNKIILDKLRTLKDNLDKNYNGNYTVHSCHLPKKMTLDKGFDTMIVDGFEEIFGDKYHCEVKETSFKEAMKKMNDYRIATAKKVDRLVILSDQKISNIALELQYFTDNRVICL